MSVVLLCSQVCSLEFDRKDIEMNKLVATCLESKIHVFDVRTQHPKRGFASVTEKVNIQAAAAAPSVEMQVEQLPISDRAYYGCSEFQFCQG